MGAETDPPGATEAIEVGDEAPVPRYSPGDFNGNGQLDNADFQALRALLREKGIL